MIEPTIPPPPTRPTAPPRPADTMVPVETMPASPPPPPPHPKEAFDETRPAPARASEVIDATRPTNAAPKPVVLPGDAVEAPTVPGYEILGVLGRGGMGVVYRARQLDLDRVVALKMILAGGHASDDDLARFVIEAEAVARIPHPNVVQIYHAGRHAGLPYFAMEYVSGGSLAGKLAAGPVPPAEAAFLLEQISRGMAASHARGVIHRDLKPANILLTTDDVPKVTDFGLAKRLDADDGRTQDGAVMGTPSYMAPEQAAGKVSLFGPPTDVYALGAILYNTLTGRPPFVGETIFDTMKQVVEMEPVAPRRLRPDTPADLETIALKCLEKDPDKRYPSADALAEDLRRWRCHEPITARPVCRRERVFKWVRRNRGLAAAGGVAAIAMVLGTAVSVYQAVRATTAEAETRDQLWMTQIAERQANINADKAKRAEAEARAAEAAARTEEDRAKTAEGLARSREQLEKAARVEADRQRLAAEALTNFFQSVLVQSSSTTQARAMLAANPNITVKEALDNAARDMGDRFADRPLVAAAIANTIGQTYYELGDYAAAEAQYTFARALREKHLGPDHADTLTTLNNIGVLHLTRRQFDRAEPLLKRAYEGRRAKHGPTDPLTLVPLGNLGDLYRAKGDFAAAEPLLARAAEGWKAAVGDAHPEYLNAVRMLAVTALDRRQFAKAEELLVADADAARQALGDDHPGVLAVEHELGRVYTAKGQHGRAQPYYEKAHAGRAAALGDRHPDTLDSLYSLASGHWLANDHAAAEPLLWKARDGFQKIHGPQHPRTLAAANMLGLLYLDRGVFDRAELFFRQVASGFAKDPGPDTAQTAGALANLGTSLLGRRKFAEAETALAEAARVRETLAPDDWATFNTRSMLGAALAGQGKFQQAEPLLKSGYEGLKAREAVIPPARKGRVGQAARRIVDLYADRNDPAAAAAWRAKLAADLPPREVAPAPKPVPAAGAK